VVFSWQKAKLSCVNSPCVSAFATGGRSLAKPVATFRKRDEINEIFVCKLDHLGELLMATPFLEALRRNVPNAEVTLVVGSWCRELADILRRAGLITRAVCFAAVSLNKRRGNILVKLAASAEAS
jgi:hypothetical protein